VPSSDASTTAPSPANPTARVQQAAQAFLSGAQTTVPAAAKELGVEQRNVWYWVRKWKGDGTADQFVAAKKAMDEGKPKEKAKGATAAAKLTFGDAGHTKAYTAAYKAAGHLVRGGTTQAQAARAVSEEHSVEFHVKTAGRAAKTVDQSPAKKGPPQKYPLAAEKKLVEFVESLRLLKLPTSAATVMNMAARLIQGTRYEADFLSADLQRIVMPTHWYYRFVASHSELKLEVPNKLEAPRDLWSTAENMRLHFEVLGSAIVDEGIGEYNADFDETAENSVMVNIAAEQAHRILSFDETHWGADMTAATRDSILTTVSDLDTGEVLAAKSSSSATLIGGSNAACDAMPMACIFSGASFKGEWIADPPLTSKINPLTSEPYRPVFMANKSGGMTHDLGVQMLKTQIEPFCPGVSPANKYIVICDGHGSHLTLDMLEYSRKKGFRVVLRPPHTTHISQGQPNHRSVCTHLLLRCPWCPF
jgi:transposase-like protein